MSAIKLSMRVRGVAEFTRKIDVSNGLMLRYTKDVVRRGTERIAELARVYVPKRTGELEGTIRTEISADGLVGWVRAGYGKLMRRGKIGTMKKVKRKVVVGVTNGAPVTAAVLVSVLQKGKRIRRRFKGSAKALKALDLGLYAPVVEYGDKRRNKPARRFLKRAFESAAPDIRSEFSHVPSRAQREAKL